MRTHTAPRGHARRLAAALAVFLASFLAVTVTGALPVAHAALPAGTALTYVPVGFVGGLKSTAQVDGYLADLDGYGIGQVLFNLPRLRRDGTLPLDATRATMLARWVQRADVYRATHGRSFEITAVINARLGRGVNLNDPITRANVVAAVRSLITNYGIAGVHLDFEPYPITAGFITLLDGLDAMFASVQFTGRLSVAAPAGIGRWSAAYWASVGARVTQVDPLFYDSTLTTVSEYEAWVVNGLAQISSAVPAPTLIVPVLAAYGTNPWHNPTVENVATGFAAVQASLAAGSRVHGAGVWWWWGLFYNEAGRYDASADRAAWQNQVRALGYTAPGT